MVIIVPGSWFRVPSLKIAAFDSCRICWFHRDTIVQAINKTGESGEDHLPAYVCLNESLPSGAIPSAPSWLLLQFLFICLLLLRGPSTGQGLVQADKLNTGITTGLIQIALCRQQ